MSTVITAAPKVDKQNATSGDVITVSIAGATAVSTTPTTRHLSLVMTADSADNGATPGESSTFTADLTGTLVKHLGVKITAITLDGVAGGIATDGQTATVTAV